MTYIGMRDPKAYGTLVVLVRNRVSIMVYILLSNRVGFLLASLEL